MTDVSNLDNLAAAIEKNFPKVKAYAVNQAKATQSQEVAIRELQAKVKSQGEEIEVLKGKGAGPGLPENPDPPPVDPPPVTPPSPTSGKHIGLKQYTNYDNAQFAYNNYDIVDLGEWAAQGAAAALSTKVLAYTSAASIQEGYWTCMDINTARAAGYILKDANGTEVFNAGYQGAKIGDIGSAAFSNAWASTVIARAQARGWDGVFIDDVTRASVESGFTTLIPVKYPSQAAWENAMVQHINIICQQLKAAGLYVMINAAGYVSGSPGWDNGTDTKAFFTRLKTYISAFMVEYWMQRGDGSGITRGSGAGAWYNNWESWLTVIPHVEAAGVDFAGLVEAPPGDSVDAIYVKATSLLEMNRPGSALFLDADRGGGQNPWGTKVGKDMGAPLSAKYQVGNQWRRNFANGVVIADPVAKTGIIP